MNSNINGLFQGAVAEGSLSSEAMDALVVYDIGECIQAALGVPVDEVSASEVLLLTILTDDSSSISYAGNTQAVCDGHNLVLEALLASKQGDGIMAHNRYLNGQVLYPYCPIAQAPLMNDGNYRPCGATPLYDQTVIMLGTVLAKSQEFFDNGVPVRSISLIITDGEDVGSAYANTGQVKAIVNDLLRTERNIVAAIGISDGKTDFRRVFREMGISDEWILLPGDSASEIRQAFQLFSQSAVRASRSAANFSVAAVGGFGA